MNKSFQIISVLSLSAALAACGGSSSGGGGAGSTATSLTGTASKGIIISGKVTAYPLVNGVQGTTSLGTATTGADGKYTLELPADYDGSPVVVTVEPASDGTTTMRCDVPRGCGTGVSYGDDYSLAAGSGFSMSAILLGATAGQTVTVNPTPLTEIATKMALGTLASASTLNDFIVKDAIADANSATADRFRITGGLNEQPVIDITDPEAVAGATSEAIIYNSLAGAIVEATQDDDNTLSIEDALKTFVTGYVGSGGIAGSTVTSGTTSLEEIFTAAQAVLTKTSSQPSGGTLDLSAATTKLTTDTATAGGEPADIPGGGNASDTAADGELAQVKAMVSDLRDIGASVSIDLTNSADAFAAEVELASIATEAGSASAISALGEATTAVAEALGVYAAALDAGTTLPISHTATNSIVVALSTGSSVVTAVQTAAVTATVSATVNTAGMDNQVDVTFTLNTSLDYTETGTESPNWPSPGYSDNGIWTFVADADLAFALTGTVSNSDVELDITDGSVNISATIDESETWSQSNTNGVIQVDEDEQLDATLNFSFDLEVSLAQQASLSVTDPTSFVGTLGFSIQGVVLDETYSYTADQSSTSGTNTDQWDSTVTFNTLDLSFSGTFEKVNQSVRAAFALSATSNGVTFNNMGIWTSSWSNTTPWSYSETDQDSDTETDNTYVDLSASLSFTATLTGISEAVSVTFGISRSERELGMATLDLAWNGNRLDFDITGGPTGGSATLLNQDGVSAAFTENVAGELSGTLSNGGSQYASIDEMGVIRYVDGVIESL